MMRRGSIGISVGGEPLIVVEESGADEEDAGTCSPGPSLSRDYSVEESLLDPYHLSPWRDTRKHSLPTPACTTGPTASQVRRLSERGESAAKEAREAAFLATLCQTSPQPGGRRHSVVTISRVPQSLFGRGRRESVAAFPALARRRDSGSKKCPPATEALGSTHNLQLDIMDDIVQARKVRMRMWNTSNEKLCEVQPMDEHSVISGSVRYSRGRRHSELVGVALPPIPARRRASDMPPPIPPRAGAGAAGGVVCTNTDLHHMLQELTSSATEIDRCGRPTTDSRRRRLADTRSNSFDTSTLRLVASDSGTTWFQKRHQTLAVKSNAPEKKKNKVTFAPESKPSSGAAKVLWDAGAVVDASALGSAIEVFLRKSGAGDGNLTTPALGPSTSKDTYHTITEPSRSSHPPATMAGLREGGERWHPAKPEEDVAEGCEATLCSSIKDLFV